MRRLAAMRGAAERKLLIAEAITIGRALLYQWHSLERLDGRTRKDRLRHLADRKHHFPVDVGNRDGAAVAALHQRSPHHFDENRITHVSSSAHLPCPAPASIEPQRYARSKAASQR
jgi:hypothetical protein